ncbi:uncharacterized protein BDR25DRAFT_295845 [Lindgomyces ingoldianus]|uniref:Uncharacterized protein n=1 Tax=Lindgomyces ingoldianus TaxID=673940 RepID=A0ACB6QDV8_9PLEO|nr:uncharacterized protein BDR25DRAFT_295845 [Lindgomyces ingoldianus]KAF2465045.1 hypothetical protein BDR25DRAFT_295845 [Lindgomyces ingoldianus]
MDEHMVSALVSTVELISSTLDAAPDSWRDQLQTIRNTTASLELIDSTPNETRRRWQIPLISVFQRVAFADADNGGVPDVANWCLRQALTQLQLYPEDVDLLTLIGQNWLLRAQKSLAKIHHNERGSSSSGASYGHPLSRSEEERLAARSAIEAEDRLHAADYVEARGILLPATEYLKRAVDAARAQGRLNGVLLAAAAESFMSLGNVSSTRISGPYFHEALDYLREASGLQGYMLPAHLQQYLEEYGPLDTIT